MDNKTDMAIEEPPKTEVNNRNKLKLEKPLVYDKVVKYEDKVKRGESIAILQFQYDYTCNFHCEHCSADKFMVKKKTDREQDSRRFFNLDDVRELSRQGDEMGLAHIVITGGEPLVYPDFDQVIEAIDPAKWYISSDSNGWHLDKERARHLKSIGVDKIQLSLDSFIREEHDKFRQKEGSYDRVLRAVDASLEAGLNLIFQTVIWKERCKSQEFLDYLEFAKSKGVGTYVTFAKPVGAWEGRMEVLCGDEEWDYVHKLGEKYNVFTHLTPGYGIDIGCIAVKRMVSVTKYGDIMPCPYTHTSLGNFFTEPLEKIINRGLALKSFTYGEKHLCLVGNKSDPFIAAKMHRMYGKPVPVPLNEVFDAEDYVTGKLFE
ncbi:MAG: radical SAM protein [Magnetococcales bacterium]|nr:radical SAM protein [Magnetococcales bacterium]